MRTSRAMAIAAIALFAFACGDDSPGSSPSVTDAGTSVATTTTGAPSDAPPPPIELAGTRWNVTDYSQGPGTITNVWKTDVTMEFDAETMSGSSGCNTYSANWRVDGPYDPHESGQRDAADGQALELSDLAWTEIGCSDPDVMEQEVEVLGLLGRAARWVLIRGELHLRDADGQYLLQAEPAS